MKSFYVVEDSTVFLVSVTALHVHVCGSCLLTVTLHIVDVRLTCLINIIYLLTYIDRSVKCNMHDFSQIAISIKNVPSTFIAKCGLISTNQTLSQLLRRPTSNSLFHNCL